MLTGWDEPAAARIADLLDTQATYCAQLGSPLYAELLSQTRAGLSDGGPAWEILGPHRRDPASSMLALRLMGAVHRLVLTGHAPRLARHYPSVGGSPGRRTTLSSDFAHTLDEHQSSLSLLIKRPVQTNEVGRSEALVGGFIEIARRTGLPLHLLELGASGGLNLCWDRYRYDAEGWGWGPRNSRLRFEDVFMAGRRPLAVRCPVASRVGCDAEPVDVSSDEGRLTLKSYIWADQLDRLMRLEAAMEIARRVRPAVERAPADEWLSQRLGHLRRGGVSVVFHSIVWQYLSRKEQRAVRQVLERAGRRARRDTALAWLRLEPADGFAELRLTLWPGGSEEVLAHSGYHGAPVTWLGQS